VFRDIDELLTAPDLGRLGWFRPTSYIDAKGETRRSVDLTRDGFTLLVMGWTGERGRRQPLLCIARHVDCRVIGHCIASKT
jgi:phage regulator Rha-like protein